MYKKPKIIMTFNMSTFEQYQPSSVEIEANIEYGEDGFPLTSLDDKGLVKFYTLAHDEILKRLIGAHEKLAVSYERGV